MSKQNFRFNLEVPPGCITTIALLGVLGSAVILSFRSVPDLMLYGVLGVGLIIVSRVSGAETASVYRLLGRYLQKLLAPENPELPYNQGELDSNVESSEKKP
jgi:hypothetical protein